MKFSYPIMMAAVCLAENFSIGRAFTPTGYSTLACSGDQQSSAYISLAGLLAEYYFQGCASDSGYDLLYSTSVPSDEEWALICSSADCQSLIAYVIAASPPDCILTVPTSGLDMNVFEFADSYDDRCTALLNPTTAPTPTPAPSSTAESTTDEPTTDESTTDEPATDEPTTDEPTTDEPTTDEPSTPTVTAAPHLSCGGEEQ